MKSVSKFLVLTALFLVAALLVSGVNFSNNAYATKEIFNAAREKFGKDIKGCKHCHVKAIPKESDHELNELGMFLEKTKKDKGASEVDVAWIADYKPAN